MSLLQEPAIGCLSLALARLNSRAAYSRRMVIKKTGCWRLQTATCVLLSHWTPDRYQRLTNGWPDSGAESKTNRLTSSCTTGYLGNTNLSACPRSGSDDLVENVKGHGRQDLRVAFRDLPSQPGCFETSFLLQAATITTTTANASTVLCSPQSPMLHCL